MKKYLIFLTIFLSSLFFIGNIKADAKVLVNSADLDSNFSGTLTTEDLQEIYNNNSNYDFVNEYKYYAIFVTHWERSVYGVNKNSNYLQIIFYNKIPTRGPYNDYFRFSYSDIKYLKLEYGCLNGTCTVDFDNIDLTKSVTYDDAKSGSKGYMTTFGNSNISFLAYDNMEPSLYAKEPTYTYEIINPSDNKWQINFNFENMSNNYYYKIIDTSNDELLFTTESNTEYWSYDVFYNKILKIKLYDKENNYISGEEIDITGIYYQENTKYSVIIKHNPRHDNGNSYNYTYYTSIKDLLGNMSWNGVSCYHGSINGQVSSWYEDDCSSTDLTITSRANEILQWKIVVGDKIVYQRQFSVVNDLVSPYIIFDIKENYNGYNVSIIGKNMIDGQYITYKIDDETTEKQITNGEIIPIFNNSRIYAYIWNTNNTVVATAYTDIVVNIDEKIENENSLNGIDGIMKYFKNISNSNNSLLTQFGKFWTNFRKSNLYLPIMISFVGSIILCIIKLLKR